MTDITCEWWEWNQYSFLYIQHNSNVWKCLWQSIFTKKKKKKRRRSSWTIWNNTLKRAILDTIVVSVASLTHTSLHVVYLEMERFHCVNKEIIYYVHRVLFNVLSKSYCFAATAPVKPGDGMNKKKSHHPKLNDFNEND